MNPNDALHGHWYCSYCQDVVNLRKPWGRWDERRDVQCPVCRNMSADWVGDTIKPKPVQPEPLSPEHGKELFSTIYETIRQLPPK